MRVVAFIVFVAGVAMPAELDAAPRPEASADATFREGRRLVKLGRYAEACPWFERSYALEPVMGTLLNRADCYEKLGRTASAWLDFVVVSRRDTSAARAGEARRRAAALEPQLARIVVAAADAPPDLRIMRDGADVAAAPGSAVPVDPGRHLVAAASGDKSWSAEVEAVAGRTVTVEVPPFWLPPPKRATPPAVAAAPPAPALPSVARVEDAPSPRRTAALVVGGVGASAVLAGAVFGVLARSSWDDSRANCHDPGNVCSPLGIDQVHEAQSRAAVSTILVGAGVAALGTAAVLWLLPQRDVTISVAPGSGSVGWTRRF